MLAAISPPQDLCRRMPGPDPIRHQRRVSFCLFFSFFFLLSFFDYTGGEAAAALLLKYGAVDKLLELLKTPLSLEVLNASILALGAACGSGAHRSHTVMIICYMTSYCLHYL